MKEELRQQALIAFQSVQAARKDVTAKECLQELEDLARAIQELGKKVGWRVKMMPADPKPLLARDFDPGVLHFHINDDNGNGNGWMLAGVYAIPDRGLLKFYTDEDDPRKSASVIGNEAALFQIVIEHLKSVCPSKDWEKRYGPKMANFLTVPAPTNR